MIADCVAWLIRLATGVQPCDPSRIHPDQSIYFANHSSHLDFLVIWAALPAELRRTTRPIAARDYWNKNPLRRWLAESLFRAILLRRSGRGKKGEHPLQQVFEALEQGESIIIFPEGTRSLDGIIKPFKAGLHALIQRYPKCHLCPVALDNLTRVLPKGEILPLPLIANAHFLPPTQLTKGETRDAFLKRMHAILKNKLDYNDAQ